VGAVRHPAEGARAASLGEVARVFLKLGTVAFGGPAAHVAMMEDEIVRRRGWLTREAFLDYLARPTSSPGPRRPSWPSTWARARRLARAARWPGACFILPAALIVGALAWAYVRYGALPEATGLLYGV
jgi:chromate transporter